MSVYSSKCDLYDSLVMIRCNSGTEEEINKEIESTDFYIYHGNKRHRLDIHTYKDLVPYFPYIVAVGCYSNTNDRQTIVLSSESYVDREEKERLGWILRDAQKEYRRCKRKKIAFDNVEWTAKSFWSDKSIVGEIAKRVAEKGDKADIEGMHFLSYDKWDRARLAQEMSRVGYSDFEISNWVYQGRDFNWKTED